MEHIISEVLEWCQNDMEYLQEIINNLQNNEVMRYIDNNLYSEFVGDRTDIILRILYQLEEYFDYKNETIDKVINLIQNANELMN